MGRRRGRGAAVAAGCAALFLHASAAAARPKTTDFPAKGAVSAWDEGAEPTPVLIVLHGDWGYGPNDLFRVFEPTAAKRKVALVALACPVDEGCAGSFWRWNGPLSFLERALVALEQKHPIDRTRLWIAGWSGGATYLGWRTLEIERTFAGIAALGGGYPPSTTACAEAPAGVWILTGDKNPLHAHVKNLADYYRTCGHTVELSLVPGADHDGEWRAIPAHVEGLFDFLAKQHRAPAVGADAGSLGDASSPDSATLAPAAPSASAAGAEGEPAAPPRGAVSRGACGCRAAGADGGGAESGMAAGAALVLAVALRSRRVSRRAPAR